MLLCNSWMMEKCGKLASRQCCTHTDEVIPRLICFLFKKMQQLSNNAQCTTTTYFHFGFLFLSTFKYKCKEQGARIKKKMQQLFSSAQCTTTSCFHFGFLFFYQHSSTSARSKNKEEDAVAVQQCTMHNHILVQLTAQLNL